MMRPALILIGSLTSLLALSGGYLASDVLVAHLHTGWTTAGLRSNADVPGDVGFHLLVTTGRTISILGGGLLCALVLAASTRLLRVRAWIDLMIFAAAVPPLVWVPLGLAAFGLNSWAFDIPASLFVGAMIAPGLLAGARGAPPAAVDAMRVAGFGGFAIWRAVVAPWALRSVAPQLMLTVALIFGVCTVVEYLAGIYGVGTVLKLEISNIEFRDIVFLTLASVLALLAVQRLIRQAVASLIALA